MRTEELRTENWVMGPVDAQFNQWQAFLFAPKDEWSTVKNSVEGKNIERREWNEPCPHYGLRDIDNDGSRSKRSGDGAGRFQTGAGVD
ncbi:hypothetical protein R1flu_009079 [Riccia fluitans]|uniref:Uncharacterized protein n=1 Tax=Riccia fluitans TaxID=41844 RepID=A0ABD1Z575_9MARC